MALPGAIGPDTGLRRGLTDQFFAGVTQHGEESPVDVDEHPVIDPADADGIEAGLECDAVAPLADSEHLLGRGQLLTSDPALNLIHNHRINATRRKR